ncbi:MAG: Ig-like domain-containing protein, partial [Pseudomonadota bacterium]
METETLTPDGDDDIFVVNTGSTVFLDVLANDETDSDEPLFISFVTNQLFLGDLLFGTLTPVEEDTLLSFTSNGVSGTVSFDYIAQAGDDIVFDSVTITVQSPPIAANDTAETDEDTPVDIDVLENDEDPDEDDLTVDSVTQGSNGTVTINDDGTVRYTPNLNFNGTDSFTYTVFDGSVGFSTATVTITVDPVNDDPIAEPDSFSTPEDTPLDADLGENDSDVDDEELFFSKASDPSNGMVVVNQDGTFTYTPNDDFTGADAFTYRVVDALDSDEPGSAIGTVMITVTAEEDAPDAADDEATTPEDTPVSINVLENDSDPDGDDIRVSAIGEVANGTAVLQDNGNILYTPDDDFFGEEVFTYAVTDENENTVTAQVTVTVTPVNDDPEANDDAASTTPATPVTINVLDNDVDPDGGILSVSAVSTPAGGTAILNENGTITYTPNPETTGQDTFTYTVEEPDEGLTATATVTVTINDETPDPPQPPEPPEPPENTPPTANPDSAETDENNAVVISVLANDTDDDGDTVTLSGVGNASNGSVQQNANGTVTYTPAQGFVGNDAFTYTISDGNGGTAQGAVSVTVNEAENPPVAVNDTAGTAAETPVTIAVLANDSDPDGDEINLDSVGSSPDGEVTANDDGTITFTPNAEFAGDASFSYTIRDETGLTASATVTVSVAEGENEDPVAGAFDVTTPEDTSITLDLAAGASDPDNDPISVGSVGSAGNGTVVIEPNGTVTYTPNDNFFGEDSFSYTVVDPFGGSGGGTVTVTVEPENDAPIAVDDPTAVSKDEVLLLGGFIGNDIEPDGEDLTVVGANGALGGLGSFFEVAGGGQAAINSDGSFLFILDGDFDDLGFQETRTVSFSYTIADPSGLTDSAEVQVTVFGEGFDDDFFIDPDDGRDDNDGIDEELPGDGIFRDGGIGDDLFVTGDGNDTLLGNGGRDTVNGNGGDDLIEGGSGDDDLDGGEGNDTVLGQDGTDFIEGGIGNDSLEGGFGNDKLFGGADNDTLKGDQGNDALIGGTGNDLIEGGSGNDIAFGNAGNDA